ncbi:hypothetical protein QAD02_003716 [Eretmocerus hayati]|uniref:Uncharacterized protein n=1 Tax=Eretmocerus hayati TaxID=131215 RepID=A0ACC2NMZ5_9HYME|nr:hypothetical protein QAD02_003716 [Eretmocerus hayati]
MPASAALSAMKLATVGKMLTQDNATLLDTNCTKAFTVLAHRPELDTTLPTMHHELHRDDGDSTSSSQSDEDEEDDDDSSSSRLTTIRRGMSKSNELLPTLPGPLSTDSHPLHQNRGCSKSQDSLRLRGSNANEFGTMLRLRLSRLQHQHQQRKHNQAHAQHPKPFVSTVRKGVFLMPPAEVAALLGIGPAPLVHARPEHKFEEQQLRRRLEARPEVRHRMHHARCHEALRGPSDLAFGSPVPHRTKYHPSALSLAGSNGASHCRSRDSSHRVAILT